MSRELIFGLSGALLVGITLYIAIRAILDRKFKPHRVTYGIFVLITAVTFINQVVNGGGYSSYFMGVSFLGVSIVFLFSFKYGMGGSSLLDKVALVSALLLAIYWISSGDSRYSTVIAVLIDIIALIPTITKAYGHPKTEIYLNWMISAFAGLLSLLAIPEFDWILYLFPIYIFFANFCVIFAKFLGHRKQRIVDPLSA